MSKITKIETVNQLENPKAKLKVAAYCRVSTASDAQLESLETQKEHYENYISKRAEWEYAGLYFDEGISGTKAEIRPQLLQLIADCKAKKVDFIITKSISRFSRNTTDCLELVRTLLDINVPVYFEKENINTGSMESELFLSILSSMAEDESASIAANISWGIKTRFKAGTFKLTSPPYGYRWNGKTLVVEPREALVVKRIFTELLAGKGAYTIAKNLNAERIPTFRKVKWHSGTILGIATNEKYVGDVLLQKTYTDSQFNKHKNTGQRDQYLVKDDHEAIISRSTFEAVTKIIRQHALEKNISQSAKKYTNRYTLSGKLICGQCGAILKRRIHTAGNYKYVAWCCSTHLANKEKCSLLYLEDAAIKGAFTTLINKLIFAHAVILKPLLITLKATSKDAALLKIKELQTELLRNTEQREILSTLMAQGYIDKIIYTGQANELLRQADNAKNEITALGSSLTGDNCKITELTKLLRYTEKALMLMQFDDAVFTDFVEKIIIKNRQKVTFVLKCGLSLTERM